MPKASGNGERESVHPIQSGATLGAIAGKPPSHSRPSIRGDARSDFGPGRGRSYVAPGEASSRTRGTRPPLSPPPGGAGRARHQANGRASGIVLSTMPRPPLPGLDDNCPPVPSAWPCGPRTGLYTCPPYRGAGEGPSVAVLGQARAGVGTGTCPSSSEPVLGPGRGRTYVAPGEAPSNPGYPVPLSHRPREGPDVTGAQPTGDANETIISRPHGLPRLRSNGTPSTRRLAFRLCPPGFVGQVGLRTGLHTYPPPGERENVPDLTAIGALFLRRSGRLSILRPLVCGRRSPGGRDRPRGRERWI